MAWIRTDNPNLRSIKIEGMDDDLWFTEKRYAETTSAVADLLVDSTEVSGISKVSEPSDPGEYYGSDSDGTDIIIELDSPSFDSITAANRVSADSLNAERTSIVDPDGEPQLDFIGIGPSNELYDIDTTDTNDFYLDNGVLIKRTDGEDYTQGDLTRFVLGRSVGLGIRKMDELDNGTQGGSSEFIKNPANTPHILIEDDFDGGSMIFETRRGGGFQWKTSDGSGDAATKIERLRIPDNEGDPVDPVFQNIRWLKVAGQLRLYDPSNGPSAFGVASFVPDAGNELSIKTDGESVNFAPNFTQNLELFGDERLSHHQATSERVVWESDTTANRPGSPVVGQRFFDTDLGQPIWYDGSNWVDATGSTV